MEPLITKIQQFYEMEAVISLKNCHKSALPFSLGTIIHIQIYRKTQKMQYYII